LRDIEEGVQSFLQIERRGVVSLLLLKVELELHLRQQNNFDLKHVKYCLTSLCGVLREARLGAQVQQRKPFLSCKHVLAHPRFC